MHDSATIGSALFASTLLLIAPIRTGGVLFLTGASYFTHIRQPSTLEY